MKIFFRWIVLVSALLLFVSMIACNEPEPDAQTTEEETTTEAPKEDPKEDSKEDPKPADPSTYTEIHIDGTPISSFKILFNVSAFDSTAETAANSLKTAIRSKTGKTLEVKSLSSATDAEKAHAIYVGKTNDPIAKDFYTGGDKVNYKQCGWKIENGKLAILGTNELTLTDSIARFTETFLQRTSTDMSITAEDNLSAILRYERFDLTENMGKNGVRIFTHNILAGSQNAEKFRQGVLAFRLLEADVYCFQEFGNIWKSQNLTSSMATMGCAEVPVSNGGAFNFTPIYYRTDRLELKDSGWELLDGGQWNEQNVVNEQGQPLDHNSSKSVTWARFLDKQSNKEFVVLNTHFTHSGGGVAPNGDSYMNITHSLDAKHVVRLAEGFREEFGEDFPVICTGDFNMQPGSEAMQYFLKGDFVLARYEAYKTKNMDRATASKGEYQGPLEQGWYVIDQTVYSGKVYPSYYEVVISPYTWRYTDHQAQLFEFFPM